MSKSDSAVDEDDDFFEQQIGQQDTAIRVLGLHKKYRHYNRSKIVLNGLNLNCQAGKLYILYGIGKSGKSAVVKSILDIESFSRGAVAIFNKSVEKNYGDVGYMPQKIGLDACLTTVESINYFANLQRLNRHVCVEKFSSMQSPMTINECNTLVKNLTGDQRRVLSFYIAIMASPKIIILDQPVAGCDPIYKRFFWQKFRSMVDNEHTTIFVTCSDEIDVKYADIVGYLRNGQIIIEESPTDLMKRYNIWSFNDLILSISVAELKQFPAVEPKKAETKDNVSVKSGGFAVTHFTSDEDLAKNNKLFFDKSFSYSYSHDNKSNKCRMFDFKQVLQQMWVLCKWQALVAGRDYLKFLFHLLLPTLCILFYGFSVGNDVTEVNLGVVFCRNESSHPIFDFENRVSNKYLTKKYYENYDEAAKDAEKGTLHGILLLNANPNDTISKYTKFGCRSSAFKTVNVVLELDASSKLIRSHIIEQLSRAYGGSKEHALLQVVPFSEDRNKNNLKCLIECPITPFVSNFKFPTTGNHESEVMHLIWGAVVTINHFSGALLGALPLCTQNRNGLMDRMTLIQVTNYQLQLVHWSTRTLFILVQDLVLLVSAIVFLKIEFSAYGFFCGWSALILQTLCGFSFGILLFAILKEQVRIILSLIVLELMVSSLSGFLWNYHGLTQLFRKLTIILPHHAVSKLLFEVVIKGSVVTELNIWLGFLSPLFWMVSTFVIYIIISHSYK